MNSLERLNGLVNKVLQNEPVTDEEYKEVIAACRENRKSAAGTGKSDKTKAAVQLPDNLLDLFNAT